jgi:nucleoside-diphosphate-sugar epimerase
MSEDLVFVTGAGGSIGRVIARKLLECGYRVRGFGLGEQYYRTPDVFHRLESVGDFKFEIGSILDQQALTAAMRGARYVVHLAAMTGRKAEENRLRCFDINVNGTQKVMASCLVNRVAHIVNISSSAVYGVPTNNPVTEDEMPKPVSAYAISKLAAEEAVAAVAQAYPDIHFTTLRLFNAYGDQGSSDRAIDTFVARTTKGLPPIVSGDGEQLRCYTHAEDIAEVIVRVLREPKARNRTYNLGNPDAVTSIRALAGHVISTMSPDKLLKPEFAARQGDGPMPVAAIWADVTRLEAEIGYRPRIGLREGLERIRAELQRNS